MKRLLLGTIVLVWTLLACAIQPAAAAEDKPGEFAITSPASGGVYEQGENVTIKWSASKECDKYIEGVGGYGQDGKHFPDWKWSCMDFDFGTCPRLEDTPCNECFDNDCKGFEWRGNNV